LIFFADHYSKYLTDTSFVMKLKGVSDQYHLCRTPFFIYSEKMEEPIAVEKVTSSVDLIPTIANLFGLDYNARYLIGNDAFGTGGGYVCFKDYTWIDSEQMWTSDAQGEETEEIKKSVEYIEDYNKGGTGIDRADRIAAPCAIRLALEKRKDPFALSEPDVVLIGLIGSFIRHPHHIELEEKLHRPGVERRKPCAEIGELDRRGGGNLRIPVCLPRRLDRPEHSGAVDGVGPPDVVRVEVSPRNVVQERGGGSVAVVADRASAQSGRIDGVVQGDTNSAGPVISFREWVERHFRSRRPGRQDQHRRHHSREFP
jgi:hypothetical protein